MIFQTWGKRYWESGFSVIPCRGKRPVIKAWEQFTNRLPTEQEIDSWASSHGSANVGLVLGPASNLSAVDIDTEDADILAGVPASNVVRRGKKGEVRFFRYSPVLQSLKRHDLGVEVFVSSGQVILPPSIHPDTRAPYVWTSGDLLDERPEPILDSIGWLRSLERGELTPATPGVLGRNNKLKDIVSAMLTRGENIEKTTSEALEFDRANHSPRLFTDPKESLYKGDGESGAFRAASDFTLSIARSLVKANLITLSKPLPEVPLIVDLKSPKAEASAEVAPDWTQDDDKAVADQAEAAPEALPEPTGLMKDIRDLILSESYRDNAMLAYGSAVAFLGAVFSNRFCSGETWPNVYVLNIAPSGAGKSVPQNVLSKILHECGELSNLSSVGLYKSGVAISLDLQSKRERLDLIDEASEIFAQIKSGRGERGDIEKTLCQLWSSGNTQFLNSTAAGRIDTGTCWNPCLNILGSTTQDAFRASVNRGLMENGLIPRFLIFEERGYNVPTEKLEARNKLFRDVVEKVKRILAIERRFEAPGGDRNLTTNSNRVVRVRPIDVPLSKSALELVQEVVAEYNNELTTTEPIWRPFVSRGIEHIARLALIKTCGDERGTVTAADVDWAREFYRVSFGNAKKLLRSGGVENEHEALSLLIEGAIREAGTLSANELYEKTRHVPKQVRKSILEDLTEADIVLKMEARPKNGVGRSKLFYRWNRSKRRF